MPAEGSERVRDREIALSQEPSVAAAAATAAGLDAAPREPRAPRASYELVATDFERRRYTPEPAKANLATRWPPREPGAPRAGAGGSTRSNLAIDLLVVSGLVLAEGLRTLREAGGLPALLLLTLMVAVVWAIAGAALGYYEATSRREPIDDAALVSAMVLGMVFVVALFDFAAPRPIAIGPLLLCWPTLIFLRIAFFRHAPAREGPLEHALVVGTGPLARITGEDLQRRGRQSVVGYLFFADEQRPHVLASPLLGTWMDLESVLRTRPVNEVYIAGDGSKQMAAVQHAISVCESLGVPFALPAYTFRLQRARPLVGKAIADGYLHYAVVETKSGQRALKRACDVLIASLALWLLSPLLLLAAALVKATSPGPVFFRQRRSGLNGRTFQMLKFRSMLADAEQRRKTLEALNECSGPVFKIRNDPRVTRVGAFLRKYSIDELPQLINVLRGEMSIVGPRPPLPDEVAKYQAWQMRRLSVRPGLTCIWQVSSGRHEMSFDEWMYLDLQYVDHWNLLKDAEVMLRTVPVVVSGSGEPTRGEPARYNEKVSAR